MMSNDKQQQLSALMDGEIDSAGQDLIDMISNDDELKDTWQRYHLIRDSLHNNLPESPNYELASSISQAISQEPTVLAPKTPLRPAYLKPVAGFAIAASVTAAVLIGVQSLQQPSSVNPQTPIVSNQPISPDLAQTVTLSQQQVQPQLADQNQTIRSIPDNARMNRYLMNYNELRASNAVQGMRPYVRIIGYEADQ